MRESLSDLWRAIFGEPPPLADDTELLGRILIESLPPAPPYQPVDLRAFRRPPAAAPPIVAEEPDDEDKALRA